MANEQQPIRRRSVTTAADVEKATAGVRQARVETEKQKEVEANSRTSANPEDARDVNKAEAEAFARAERETTGNDPLPQRTVPTDNSLPDETSQYVVPRGKELADLEAAAAVNTAPMALEAAKKRQADADERKSSAARTQKYIVQGGSIFTSSGKARPGDVVELTRDEAKHYNALGRLAPFIDNEDEE